MTDSGNPSDNGLTPKQLKVIPYLVEYPCMTEAAEQSGVSRKTLYEWMKKPAFRDELEKQRCISYDETIAKFCTLGDQAIEAYKIAVDTYEHRRAAASDIIKFLLKTKENSSNAQRLNELARRQDEILKRLIDIEADLLEKPKRKKTR